MSENVKLGKLIRSVEIDGAIFHIRGLTVGEYVDLSMQDMLSRYSDSLWVEIAYTAVVDWEGILDEDEHGDVKEIPFSVENLELLPDSVIQRLGREIYENQTELSREERDKFIAGTRFLHFCSEPKNKPIVDTFDCDTCIKKGLARSRPCGRFSPQEIEDQYRVLNGIGDVPGGTVGDSLSEPDRTPKKNLKNRYKVARASLTPKHQDPIDPKRANMMSVGGFQYKECPVSYVDSWISHLVGILYHCAKSNIPFADGGVRDQPNKLYQAERTVASESSKIESEEMDAIHKKNKK